MIKLFATVGVQLPFDRLTRLVLSQSAYFEIRAQTGNTQLQLPTGCERFLTDSEYRTNVEWCDLIVSHAGMGSILTAIEFYKPIFLLPRVSALGEHRNDHQLDTIEYISNLSIESNLIHTAKSTESLKELLLEFAGSPFASKTNEKERCKSTSQLATFVAYEALK